MQRPPVDELLYVRHNGHFVLRVVGDPEYGLPWGQDRLIPIWLATEARRRRSPEIRFASAADVLECFGLSRAGTNYKRLVDGFKRIHGSTFTYKTECLENEVIVFRDKKFSFTTETQLWYDPAFKQTRLPGLENVIVLSPQFWAEIQQHPVPVDLQVVRALAGNAGALDLYMWLTWRCWKARTRYAIPLYGQEGLIHQFGIGEYARPRKFRERLRSWLAHVVLAWPECPARLNENDCLVIAPGSSVRPKISTIGL